MPALLPWTVAAAADLPGELASPSPTRVMERMEVSANERQGFSSLYHFSLKLKRSPGLLRPRLSRPPHSGMHTLLMGICCRNYDLGRQCRAHVCVRAFLSPAFAPVALGDFAVSILLARFHDGRYLGMGGATSCRRGTSLAGPHSSAYIKDDDVVPVKCLSLQCSYVSIP